MRSTYTLATTNTSIFPNPPGGTWSIYNQGIDVVTLSAFPATDVAGGVTLKPGGTVSWGGDRALFACSALGYGNIVVTDEVMDFTPPGGDSPTMICNGVTTKVVSGSFDIDLTGLGTFAVGDYKSLYISHNADGGTINLMSRVYITWYADPAHNFITNIVEYAISAFLGGARIHIPTSGAYCRIAVGDGEATGSTVTHSISVMGSIKDRTYPLMQMWNPSATQWYIYDYTGESGVYRYQSSVSPSSTNNHHFVTFAGRAFVTAYMNSTTVNWNVSLKTMDGSIPLYTWDIPTGTKYMPTQEVILPPIPCRIDVLNRDSTNTISCSGTVVMEAIT